MKRQWTTEELVEQWSLEPSDEHLLFHKEKRRRLGLLAQLTFYRRHRRFPEQRSDFAPSVVVYLAEQIDASIENLDDYGWNDRSGRRHREWILELLEVRPFDRAAREAFRTWLITSTRVSMTACAVGSTSSSAATTKTARSFASAVSQAASASKVCWAKSRSSR